MEQQDAQAASGSRAPSPKAPGGVAVVDAVAACAAVGGATPVVAGEIILGSRQKDLQALFLAVFGKTTNSFNNE